MPLKLPPQSHPPMTRVDLRKIIVQQMDQATCSGDRQKYAVLLDCLSRVTVPYPSHRLDGRTDQPTRAAALYALVLQAVVAFRDRHDRHPVFGLLRKALDGRCRLAGGVAVGYALEVQ